MNAPPPPPPPPPPPLSSESPDGSPTAVDAFLARTIGNVRGSLADLERLGQALAGRAPRGEPCQLMDCPRGAQLRAAVEETIRTLEETKSAFKSKTLADLRQRLELLLRHTT